MKKLLKMLIFLFTIYFIIQILLLFLGPGYETKYSLSDNGNTYTINEKYQKDYLYQLSNYYLTISLNNQSFDYQIVKTNNMGTRIINSVKYYSDNNYNCILPIFKNKDIKYDITCLNNGKLFYYHDIKNKDSNLDNFAKSIKEYDINNFINDENKNSESNNMLLYINNLIPNYHLFLLTENNIYSSSYIHNSFAKNVIFDDNNINLNSNTIYVYVNNYLVIASYSESNNFNKFILIDQDSNSHFNIDTSSISFNSYIQGIVDNSVYLIDRESKKQYEINVKDKSILVVGTEVSGTKYYNNGHWETISMQEVLDNNLKFIQLESNVTKNFNGYDKVIKYGINDIGYYYYFKSNNNQYDVYSSPIKNPNQITYLFSSNMDKIKYDGDYIYFIDNGLLKYYHPQKGLRTLANIHVENIINYNIYYD